MSGKVSRWEDEGGCVSECPEQLAMGLLELRVEAVVGSVDCIARARLEWNAPLGSDARVVFDHLDDVHCLRDFIDQYSLTHMSRERVLEAILDLVATKAVTLT